MSRARLEHNAYMRAWKKKNPDKVNAYKRRRNASDAGFAAQVGKMRERYGITLDQYHALFEKQNEQCAICGRVLVPLSKETHVDHDHKTKIVRGLLCGTCNRGLGQLQESSVLLARASSYVAKYEAA